MKIKSLILGMLSFAAVVACTQEQLVTPKLDVDKTEVSVEAVAGEATINVTSNVEWKASSDADWVSINPSSGKDAKKAVAVKITAEDNDSEQARTATVIVEAGDLEKTVKVTQAGKSEEPGPEPGPEYTLDGKQWVFTWSAMNVEAVADLGVTQEGTIILAVDGAIMGMTGYVPYITGTYEVKPTDGTSGVVEFVDPTDPSATKISISYKELTETTVKFTLEAFQMVDVEAVAAAEKIEIGAGEPEPEPEAKKYLLVGDAVPCGWDPANGVVLTLKDGYYVAKGVEITAKKGMHFTLNASWEGSIKGKEGLIRPNTIGEVGNNDISLTEGGKFDVYFAETLDKFYFMSEGKLPSEATEHEPIEVSWGVCGTLVGNSWGATDDPVMTKEGEWYVAKGIQFESEINFKVRGNNSWADDVKWGVAVQDQVCSLNSAIAVSTCTEFKAANSGAGDNPNIFIAAPVGEYDIYFSLEKKEVWVMNPGLKPGDDAPVLEETYTVTGTMTDNQWNNNGAIGLMTLEGDYYVAKNLPFVWSSSLYEDSSVDAMEFKICKTGTWDAYGLSDGTPAQSANTEIAVTYGGGNIVVSAPAGSYDVYFDKANGKLWVMTAGLKPGETPVEKPYTIVAENVMEANEIIPYNESCLIVRGKDLMIYRMAYNSADGTFAPAELKADWSSYVTLWLAKGPGNYLHFGNMYDTWAVYNCGDDASTLPAWDGICDGVNEGVIVGAASTYWPVRTGHPTGILGFLGDGQLLYYGLDDKARLQKQADGVTNVYAYTTGFNFAAYSSKSFCYGFELVCVDLEGKMWLHTWDAATLTYSLTPKQIGSGWDKFTHLIPWGDDLLARDGEGTLYRYKFNLDNFWEVE